MKYIYLKLAGIINALVGLLHLVAGQMDLVDPLLGSDLTTQQKSEWIGAWHIVTILLFVTSFIILRSAFSKAYHSNHELLKSIAWLYIIMGISFIVSSIWFQVLAPQFILLMPIGVLIMIHQSKIPNHAQ